MSFSAQSEKKNLQYLATLPLAIVSPFPALDTFIACRSPGLCSLPKRRYGVISSAEGGGGVGGWVVK